MNKLQTDKVQIDGHLKYQLYEKSVQSPIFEIEFIQKEYRRFFQTEPYILCEDFCGTGLISSEWVKLGADYFAHAIDLDPEPLSYGRANHLEKLNVGQKKRLIYSQQDVLTFHNSLAQTPSSVKIDVVVALNFAACFFKTRESLLEYFQAVRKSLRLESMLVLDIFGGFDSQIPTVEETKHEDFCYFWDCEKFNPITNETLYKIHFKLKGGAKGGKKIKYKDVFVYDWRLWSIPELKELLLAAGFSKAHCYWEGDDEDSGGGNGDFQILEQAENCQSWVAYVLALP